MLKIKRIYDKKTNTDGKRVYIDRLWPRGLKKEDAAIDEWIKDLSPTDNLRKWLGHEPEKFAEFRNKYIKELSDLGKTALIKKLAAQARDMDVTLLYSARDTQNSNAVVLAEVITNS